jgi:hypothetical protein
MGLVEVVRSLDFFREVPRDLTEPSLAGGLATIIAFTSSLFLLLSELSSLMAVEIVSHTFVDDQTHLLDLEKPSFSFLFNISFPSLPCALISVDAQDILGSHDLDIRDSNIKLRLDKDGKLIALFDEKDANTEKALSQKDEGCRIEGVLFIKKVIDLMTMVDGLGSWECSYIVSCSYGACKVNNWERQTEYEPCDSFNYVRENSKS